MTKSQVPLDPSMPLPAPTPKKSPLPPTEPPPAFVGMIVLPATPLSRSQESEDLYRELWNKISWAVGTAYKSPYRGSSPIRALARRLTLIVIANEHIIQPKS